MTNYYEKVEGDIAPGKIAKADDINDIQQNIADALRNMLDDNNEGHSYILGDDEDAFILLPAPMVFGRYIDTYNVPDQSHYVELDLNRYRYKQPITKTKTSLYSVLCKIGNKSYIDCTVHFELQDRDGNILRKTSLVIPHTEPAEFEVVFDLDYYPTAPGLDSNEISVNEGKNISLNSDDESYEEGVEYDEPTTNALTLGASQLYFVAWAADISETDYAENGDEDQTFNEGDLYIIGGTDNTYAACNRDAYVEQDGGSGYEPTSACLYFKDVYATEPTYICQNMGEGIVGGEKVKCIDTHVSISGGSEYGNVLSYVYMDQEGHLDAINSFASESTSTNVEDHEFDNKTPLPTHDLLIAKILTYADYSKTPEVVQNDDEQIIEPGGRTRLRSHHERIRRLEKQMNYVNDIAIPPRLKYTLTGNDALESEEDGEATKEGGKDTDHNIDYIITTDEDGHAVIRTTKNKYVNAKITLRSQKSKKNYIMDDITTSDSKKTIDSYKPDDITRLNQISEMKNLGVSPHTGRVALKPVSGSVATTEKEAKLTTFNPWDDNAANRPKSKKNLEVKQRRYKVVKGKNGKNDWDSKFCGMTLYIDKTTKLKKLNIPITKFENCESVKFVIWKRQKNNKKKNTVWFQKKIYTSKSYKIDKWAKKKGKYQYITQGFRLNFGKGLVLEPAQYVIVAFPTPKSKEGALYVATYNPGKSRDFCIVYHGAADGSHFLLKDRFQEVWYNAALATGEIYNYATQGHLVSGKITYSSGDPITQVKVSFGSKSVPDGCSIELYGDTGNGWQKLNIKKNGAITPLSRGNSFRWKLVMKGNTENTPVIRYNKKKKYAIQFILTRSTAPTGPQGADQIERNMSITSKTFDGDEILKEYIGDSLFDTDNSRFSNYEFARVWTTKEENPNMLIDISASDQNAVAKTTTNSATPSIKSIPVYSLHYCDLTLDDFNQDSVDYTNYDSQAEYDEHNMRLKIDTEYSYNDDDIYLISGSEFKPVKNLLSSDITKEVQAKDTESQTENTESQTENTESQTESTEEKEERLSTIKIPGQNNIEETPLENQTLLKATLTNPINITSYTNIKLGLQVGANSSTESSVSQDPNEEKQEPRATIKGLALYLSSAVEEDTPSNNRNDPENLEVLSGSDLLLDSFTLTDNDLVSKYDGKILKVIEQPKTDSQATTTTYYKYVRTYQEDPETHESWVEYKKQQIHDLKSYVIYKLPAINVYSDNDTVYFSLAIDQDNVNLQYVKEIGLISLFDETTMGTDGEQVPYYEAPKTDVNLSISMLNAIENDWVPIFDPADKYMFVEADTSLRFNPTWKAENGHYLARKHGNLKLNGYYYEDANENTAGKIKQTTPPTMQLAVRLPAISANGEMLFYYNIKKSMKDYNHIGIQMSADCYIPKNALKMNLCADYNGQNVIESIYLPSLNYIFYPNDTTPNDKGLVKIGLSKIFKKIEKQDNQIKSVSIVATDKFRKYMNTIFPNGQKKIINMFLGKIVFYKARTIPIFHHKMRYKFYNLLSDGIQTNKDNTDDAISIRKIGVVCDYK